MLPRARAASHVPAPSCVRDVCPEGGVLEFGTCRTSETATWNQLPKTPPLPKQAMKEAYTMMGASCAPRSYLCQNPPADLPTLRCGTPASAQHGCPLDDARPLLPSHPPRNNMVASHAPCRGGGRPPALDTRDRRVCFPACT
jgi:hypothetical protein